MSTVKNQTIGGRSRLRRSLALLCVAVLLLGLWTPWAKAAGGDTITITVTDITDAPVSGLTFLEDGSITVTGTTADTYTGTFTPGGVSLGLAASEYIIISGTYTDGDNVTENVSIATNNEQSRAAFALAAGAATVNLVVAKTIVLTASESPDMCRIMLSQGGLQLAGPPSNVAAGVDLAVEIGPPNGQSFQSFVEGDSTVLQTCTLNGATVAMNTLTYVNPRTIHGIIPGSLLTTGGELSITVNPAMLVQNIGVLEATGPGYALRSTEGLVPPPAHELQASLTVEAGYSNSVPELTAPAVPGCIIQLIRSETDPGTGEVIYDYSFAMVDTVSFTENLAVTVSGIVPNEAPPPSGGDSGGGDEYNTPATPAIRVENELNKGDIKSDTTLWPTHTTESGGVSTTTVTDAELEALLELARQHAKDTEDIPGEGLKEGIFHIEDLHADSKNSTYVLELTGDQLHALEQANWDRLTVQTPAGSFSLYPEALAQTGAEITDGNQPVCITLHRLDYENRPGVDASLTVDKNQVTSFETPYGVRIVVPYTPHPGEDLNALIIDYIHEDGTTERVTECYYDQEAGGLVFFTTHLSKFGVAYRPAVFVDVTAKHWANPYVTFLASRGVITDYGDKKFHPDDLATRGETIAMLTKALSAVKCPKKPIQVYTDVALSSSLSGASNWLYFNNLASFFITGTQLKPDAPVAKQDVAALVNNVAVGVGLRVRSRGLDTGYTDLGELADYAKPAVIRLTAAGVLPMTSNFKFNPKTNLNRGELAQITATLLSNL